jgi:hypothetical protein
VNTDGQDIDEKSQTAVTPLQPFGIKDLWPLHRPLQPRYSAVTFTTAPPPFATEFKSYTRRVPRRFNPVKCIGVIRKPLIGKPKKWMMTTNHSERCNLSIRLFNRRFTRKTICYSKKLRNHKLSVALQIAHFNFCRPHSSLKIKATETTPAKEQTPAMAQGITNHVWTVEHLLGGF